jgi:hypothetical protein
MKLRMLCFSLALLGSAILTPSARASLTGTPLPVGPLSVTPIDVTALTAGDGLVLIATRMIAVNISTPGDILTGNLQVGVLQETKGPAPGSLDFIYQFTNTSTATATQVADFLNRLSASSFTGFQTSVGYLTSAAAIAGNGGAFTSGTVVPADADRKPAGSVVGFNVSVGPGTTSDILFIGTLATNKMDGTVGVQDGGNQTNGPGHNTPFSFQPVIGTIGIVPEPSSMALAGLGALGLIGYGLRRKALGA